jgi:hypothetical protein
MGLEALRSGKFLAPTRQRRIAFFGKRDRRIELAGNAARLDKQNHRRDANGEETVEGTYVKTQVKASRAAGGVERRAEQPSPESDQQP